MPDLPIDPKILQENAWRFHPLAFGARLTVYGAEHERFEWYRHLEYAAMTIAEAVGGTGPQYVVFNFPPQQGKSHLTSKWTPAWFLNELPHKRVVLGSYSGEYAEVWGRRTRDVIERFKSQLYVRISDRSSAAGEWETTAGGGMVAVGVGGALTGRSADLAIVDDPYKDSAEANSPTMRARVWEWFRSVVMTRLAPKAPLILIQTRWHPKDLTGQIIEEMNKDKDFPRFKIVNLKAISEGEDPLGRKPGEALWPERYDINWLKRQKKLLGTYFWNALYQGRPSDPEGGFFQRKWFDIVERSAVPAGLKLTRFWDLAATVEGEKGNNDPDYTAGVLMGMSHVGVYYILDCVRVRQTPQKVQELIKNTARRDGVKCAVRLFQDAGQAGKSQVADYQRNVLKGYDCRAVLSRNSVKVPQGPLGAYNAACERGDVKLVRGTWNDDFIEEHACYPNSPHDDMQDAACGAHHSITGTAGGWDQDSMRRAFSYKQSKQGSMSLEEVLEARRRNAVVVN